MVKFQRVKQKARFILNSDDAVKTLNTKNTIPVADTPINFDGSQGLTVDITKKTLIIPNHSFNTADNVVYTTSGTAIGNLTNNQSVYVVKISDDVIQLATTASNATLETPVVIDLFSTGSGEHTLTKTIQFDGSSTEVVLVDDDVNQLFLPAHNLNDGDILKYSATTGTPIQGLTNDNLYVVIFVDDDHIGLTESIEEFEAGNPINISAVGTGSEHILQKIVIFNSASTPVVDLANNQINIPVHNLTTGDRVVYQTDGTVPIDPLVDNSEYYVIRIDADSIRLAYDEEDALDDTPIDLKAVGDSPIHSFTRVRVTRIPVCTNYKFKFENLPVNLNDKCRLAVQSFEYVKNYSTFNCSSIGAVYIQGLHPIDIYQSQGNFKGTLLLATYFGESFYHTSHNLEDVSYPLPSNMTQMLQNGLDIFVDTKKLNQHNNDIQGCIDEDSFNLTLVIYELEDFEYISGDLNERTRNYHSAAKML